MTSPRVSVVMGVRDGAEHLHATIASVLRQQGVDLELVIVDDGSDERAREVLASRAAGDARLRVLAQEKSGLTRALIRGCAAARGAYIARQDNGDLSLPGRLAAQAQALDRDAALAFVSCWTEFCGPGDEFLTCGKGTGVASSPVRVASADAPNGMTDAPSCHPSVMLRRDVYASVGGYRPQFYFGQDWDLWFRLAEAGSFQMIERVLYRTRIMPDSLSGRHRLAQERIAALAREAMRRRRSGRAEDDLLQRAEAIRPSEGAPISPREKARGLYFIGEQLRRNRDARAAAYLGTALELHPAFPRAWLRLWQLRLQGMAREPGAP